MVNERVEKQVEKEKDIYKETIIESIGKIENEQLLRYFYILIPKLVEEWQ